MESRYSLRFDSGERRGETVALSAAGATVGRKPGNSIQLLDPSVSGKHAELLVAADAVTVRDLGSTNGTRVGGERVSERRLAHGDAIVFGNVKLTFLDATLDAPPPSEPKPEDASPASAGEGVRQVSSAAVARSRGRPILAVGGGALVLAAAASFYLWWRSQQAADSGGPALAPVVAVPGNLLVEGYSFEGAIQSTVLRSIDPAGEAVEDEEAPTAASIEPGAWDTDAGAPAAFDVDSGARRSGAHGLAVALDPAAFAQARSPEVALPTGRAVAATAWLRTDGGADVRLGIEFVSSAGACAPTTVWSLPRRASAEFEPLELRSAAPRGYDRVRVVVMASAGAAPGGADVDDVSLVAADSSTAPLSIDEYQLAALGEPATAATLFKIDRTLLSGIAVREPGDRAVAARAAVTASRRETAFVLTSASPGPLELDCTVEPALAALGVATLGASGYRSHQVEFERDDALGILCGTGKDLVRIAFESPARVWGRPEAGGFSLRVALGAERSIAIQVAFRSERDAAQALARTAREAERAGRLGESLLAWRKLRDEHPFEPALMAEAETASARTLQVGADELRRLAKEVERARFFRLVDLYRACRASAEALAARFTGSEIEAAVRDLAAAIVIDLAALERDLDRAEVARLEAIAAALDAGTQPRLAARVRAALAEKRGER